NTTLLGETQDHSHTSLSLLHKTNESFKDLPGAESVLNTNEFCALTHTHTNTHTHTHPTEPFTEFSHGVESRDQVLMTTVCATVGTALCWGGLCAGEGSVPGRALCWGLL